MGMGLPQSGNEYEMYTRETNITTEKTAAVDAVELNPTVAGTMANKIKNLMWSDWTTVAFPFVVPNDGFLRVVYSSPADTFGYLYLKSALYGYNYAVSSCVATGISDGICTPVKKGDTISIQGLQGNLGTVNFMQTHVN